MPREGWSEKRAETLCDSLLRKPERAPAEQRNEVFAPAARAVEDGGGGRPAAPIFTPPATRNGARKKETWRRLTKSWVCERHWNPPCPCPTCALTRRGVRHCCSRGHHGHPKGVCMPCTPRHTPQRARLARQRTPGVGGTPAFKRLMGRAPPPPPPGGLHARHKPAHPPAPNGGVRGMKQQREGPPRRDPPSAQAWRAPRSGTAARALR